MNSISDAHANKRINEFVSKGHDVKVFGFERDKNVRFNNEAIVIGRFSNTLNYRKRIGIYINGLRKLFKVHANDDCIWFYQGLDVAFFAFLLNKNKNYIYEECDLVHTNIRNKMIRFLFEKIDKQIIKHSYKTIMTSEGFLMYHYGAIDNVPKNIVVIPNKLPKDIAQIKESPKVPFDNKRIKFAFVGGLRYRTLLSIADIITRNYPNHEFHFYGFVSPIIPEKDLPKRANIFYHGAYKSPDDLPSIYSNVDVLISTYDIKSENVRYAEPNKLYDAIYFKCPIIVSDDTFLADKVRRMGIGYAVNAFDEKEVKALVGEIENSWAEKMDNLYKIDKNEAIDDNNEKLIIKS